MFVAGIYFFCRVILPVLLGMAIGIGKPLLLLLIICLGIALMFGAVGLTVSGSFGTSILTGILSLFGICLTAFFRAIGWIFRQIILSIPWIYENCYRATHNRAISVLITTIITIILI